MDEKPETMDELGREAYEAGMTPIPWESLPDPIREAWILVAKLEH